VDDSPVLAAHAVTVVRKIGVAEQGVEADEAEHNGASQLNSSVRQTIRVVVRGNECRVLSV
jgi:hypothetical protein